MKIVKKQANITKELSEPRAPQELFPPIVRPTYTDDLSFPEDITRCALKEISTYLGRYTGLHAYAIAEHAKLEVEMLKCRSACAVRRNDVSRTAFTGGRSKYQADIQVRLDMRMQQLEQQQSMVEQKMVFIKSRVEIFDRYCSTLSREVTRRLGEMRV